MVGTLGQELIAIAPDDVTITLSGDDHEQVELSAPYVGVVRPAAHYRESVDLRGRRPLDIALAIESTFDADAKRDGISRELQTGDADFDALVYITTETPLAGAVLANRELRDAVKALLRAGFSKIVIDDEHARITATCTGTCAVPAGEVLACFRAIVANVPRVEASSVARSSKVPMVTGLGLLVGTPIMVAVAMHAIGWLRAIGGILAGAVVGAALGLLLGRFERGRSDSHVRRRLLTGATIMAGVMLAESVALLASGERGSMLSGAFATAIAVVSTVMALRE